MLENNHQIQVCGILAKKKSKLYILVIVVMHHQMLNTSEKVIHHAASLPPRFDIKKLLDFVRSWIDFVHSAS